ncbi:MAG TPA: ABC transporter substrate-binding protein [Candidatus Acidoferrales bacterium]|nr:ABC transporter substrate-binding protein [Candidatus Acidoferrales bacterium]
MKRKFLYSVLTGLLVFAATSAVAQSKISGDVVKIGVLTDLSGLYSDLSGQGSVTAAQMAVDEMGGKVLGKPVQVISADHQNKADVGANKAREWYDREGVDLIVDTPNSGVALAVTKVAAEKHRLFINTGAGSTRLTNEDCNPYMIHWVYDTYATGTATGKAVVQAGGKTWFFITADYAFGKSLQQDTTNAVQAAGGKVLGSVTHPLNASDFSSYLLQAQSSKAQVIGMANAGGDTINTIKTANQFGITKTQKLAALLMFITDVNALGLNTTQGMYVASSYYWDLNDNTRKFGKAFFAKTKKMPTMDQAGVYSAVLQYLKAIQAVGTDDADAVRKHLESTTMSDAFMTNAKIRPDGRLIKDFYLFQVKSPGESKYPWDYYKLLSTIPGDQAFQPLSQSRCPLVKK